MVQQLGFRSHVKAFQEYIDFPYFVGKLDAIIADPLTYGEQIETDGYDDYKGLCVTHTAYAREWLGTYRAIIETMLPDRFEYENLERLGQDTEQRYWALETLEECIETAARRCNADCFTYCEDGDVFIGKHFEPRSLLPTTNTTSLPPS
jgi:hypothetical protein